MSQVSVTIGGKLYRMACDDGQEGHLAELATKLDSEIERFRRDFGVVGEQRLTVMAAIKALDALFEAEARIGRLEGELAAHRAADAGTEGQLQARDAELAARIHAVAAAVELAAGRLAADPSTSA